jgi:hypothetical protein
MSCYDLPILDASELEKVVRVKLVLVVLQTEVGACLTSL